MKVLSASPICIICIYPHKLYPGNPRVPPPIPDIRAELIKLGIPTLRCGELK
ncbi:hypothetical protein BDN72DRAFT_834423, partial [Pluteus cervinus]